MMTIFLVCASIGVIFLVLSLAFGGDHDVGSHMDHSMGDHHGGDSINLFSMRSVTAFLAIFGSVGAACLYYGVEQTYSILIGSVSGLAAGFLAAKLMQVVSRQQISSTQSISDFVGSEGVVTTSVPPQGVGEVTLVLRGQRKYFQSSSVDGTPIDQNVRVKVVSHAGLSLVVERLS